MRQRVFRESLAYYVSATPHGIANSDLSAERLEFQMILYSTPNIRRLSPFIFSMVNGVLVIGFTWDYKSVLLQ